MASTTIRVDGDGGCILENTLFCRPALGDYGFDTIYMFVEQIGEQRTTARVLVRTTSMTGTTSN